MRKIFENSAQNVYDGGDVRYFYYITIYSQSLLPSLFRKLFKMKTMYRVVLNQVRKEKFCGTFETTFQVSRCDSYVEGKGALVSQLDSLRNAGDGSMGDRDSEYVKPLIDSAVDFAETYLD